MDITTGNATKTDILNSAIDIYEDYPEIVNVIKGIMK